MASDTWRAYDSGPQLRVDTAGERASGVGDELGRLFRHVPVRRPRPVGGSYRASLSPPAVRDVGAGIAKLLRRRGVRLERLGEGVYGQAFRVSSGVQRLVAVVAAGCYNVVEGKMRLRGPAVLKVQVLRDAEDEARSNNEDALHRLLSELDFCYRGVRIRGEGIVPRFGVGGTLERWFGGADPVLCRVHLTVMELVPGRTLYKHLAGGAPVTPLLYARVERAFLLLWLVGVSHADAHENNVLISSGGHPVVIDFGMSVIAPSAVRRAARNVFAGQHLADNPNAAYDDRVLPVVRAIMGARRYEWFNSESRLLKRLRQALVRQGHRPCDVEAARYQVWKVEGGLPCASRGSEAPMTRVLEVRGPRPTCPRR